MSARARSCRNTVQPPAEHRTDLSRRRILAGVAAAALAAALPGVVQSAEEPLRTRKIPHSGEELPVIGIGTAVIFDFENDTGKYAERRQVIQALVAGGGKVIDTAHSYGRADRVGDLVADLGMRDKLFLATKYSYRDDRTAATASLQASLKRLKTDRVDLMQAWNVGDEGYDFALLREWKAQKLCRYVGVTTSFSGQYRSIAKVLARGKPDFFQVTIRWAIARRKQNSCPPRATPAPPSSSICRSAGIRFSARRATGRFPNSLPSLAPGRGLSFF